MKLTVKLWRWWKACGDYPHTAQNVFICWILTTIAIGMIGGFITMAVDNVWPIIVCASLSTLVIWGSLLGAVILDSIVGVWRAWNWLLGKAFAGMTRTKKWLRSDDRIFGGNINTNRFEIEHLPNVESTAGLDPLAVVTEFLSDQRQKPLDKDEKITVHGSSTEDEYMTVLFTLSKSSFKMSSGVKTGAFKSVTVELKVHFIAYTKSLHITGAIAIPLETLANAVSSEGVIDDLCSLRALHPNQRHGLVVLPETTPRPSTGKVAC